MQIAGHLTKLWKKQKWVFLWNTVYYYLVIENPIRGHIA